MHSSTFCEAPWVDFCCDLGFNVCIIHCLSVWKQYYMFGRYFATLNGRNQSSTQNFWLTLKSLSTWQFGIYFPVNTCTFTSNSVLLWCNWYCSSFGTPLPWTLRFLTYVYILIVYLLVKWVTSYYPLRPDLLQLRLLQWDSMDTGHKKPFLSHWDICTLCDTDKGGREV